MNAFFSQYSPADLLMAGLLLFGAIQGLLRGLSGEFTRLFGLVAAVVGSWLGYRHAGAFLLSRTDLAEPTAYTLGLVITLIAVLLVVRLLGLVLRSVLEFTFKGPVERIGGATAGVLRIGLYLSVVILAVNLWHPSWLYQRAVEESVIGTTLTRWMMPLYQDLAHRHPEWPLPAPRAPEPPPGDERPARTPARHPDPDTEANPAAESPRGPAGLFPLPPLEGDARD